MRYFILSTAYISLLIISNILLTMAAQASDTGVLNLSLQDAINIALENNTDIQLQKKNVDISEGEIQTQKGVFDPILNIGSFYNDAKIPTTSTFIQSGEINEDIFNAETNLEGRLPTGTFYDVLNFDLTRTKTDSPIQDLSPSWFTSLSFTVGQDLLRNFGKSVNDAFVITAIRSSEISRKELERRISDVLLNVERSYWILVAAIENLELEQTALELAQDLQKRNEIQVEVGVLPPVAVTQAKSEVAAREVTVISAENTLRAAEDNLKNILAIDLSQAINPTEQPTTEVSVNDEAESLAEAYAERPEMEEAKLNIENRETLKKYYSNQRLPRLAVQGSVELQGLGGDENPLRESFGGVPEPIPPQFDRPNDTFRNLFEGNYPTWQILGVFSFPIFNRTARGDYVKASAELDRSVILLKQTKDNIALDVKNAVREIENSLRRIEAAKVAVALAEEVVNNEQERLNVGIGTTREVLEAQRDLIDAGTQEIRAVANYNIALAELEHAKGTLLVNHYIEIEEQY